LPKPVESGNLGLDIAVIRWMSAKKAPSVIKCKLLHIYLIQRYKMPDEAEHNLKSKSVEEFNKPQRPVRVFLSYASEDSDIAKAIYDSFIALNAKSSSNIRVIWDNKVS
jgi:hypothetical protein